MPRSNTGVVTLPAGNPVVSNTDITTTWANPTMSDLASMMQDSLSRTGNGGMLVPFQNLDGTVTNPGITFSNATGTGWYRTATTLALSWVGVIKAAFSATLARFYTPVQMDSTLAVTGAATLASTLAVTGNAAVTGTLAVTGTSAFTGRVTSSAGYAGILTTDLPTISGLAQSLSSGADAGTTSATPIPAPNLEVTGYVGAGQPVFIELTSATPGTSVVQIMSSVPAQAAGFITLYRAVGAGAYTSVCSTRVEGPGAGVVTGFPLSFKAIDTPAAGTIYKYKIYYEVTLNTTLLQIQYAQLTVSRV